MSKTDTENFWQGQRVRLRPWTRADLDASLAEESDSEAIRVLEGGVQPPRSREMLEVWFERYVSQANPDILSFAVESLTGELVGAANIRDWNNRHGTFTFAIRIYRAYQRKGYARDAVRLLLRYGFGELRCQKANSATLASNQASINLHHTLGFQDEGRLRRNCYTNGRYQDEVLFGLTREEFEQMEQREWDVIIENALNWAQEQLGTTDYRFRCLAFVEDAYEQSNQIELFGGSTAHESAQEYGVISGDEAPPRGAFVFYDCWGVLDEVCPGEYRNWGHVGLSLGDGRVIHAWDRVRIDDYHAVELLPGAPGWTSPRYTGWTPVQRALQGCRACSSAS